MRTSLILAASLVLLGAPSLAEEAEPDADPTLRFTATATGETPRLFGHEPIRELRASAFGSSRISLWAEKERYARGVGEPFHSLEAGAALRFLEDWRLTAGYRVAGHFSSAGSGGIDLGLAAPFLKLGMDF